MSAVFADVDTGIDDAIALIYLLASGADLIGVASTGGNLAVDQVCANNLDLLQLCGATHVPVSRGADQPLAGPGPRRGNFHGRSGLGYAELPASDRTLTAHDAATAWVRAAHRYPGELIGVATGPLTNLALALRVEPALPQLLHRLVIMGGMYGDGTNTDREAEWNVKVDPEATAEVLAAWAGQRRQPVVCGLDLTRTVAMTPDLLARLSGPNPVSRFIQDAMRFYFEVHRDRGLGYLAHLHDPLAAAVALDPQLVVTRAANVTVDLADDRGITTAAWESKSPNAHIGIRVDTASFMDRLITRIAAFAESAG
ncbi:nucleoside hydrolase [Mycobacterium asiaticum]|uniref:Nucleoside hydrolase n=1 Tax=Mycobacterium asiaticum TaxID=1790 RepID=A0A1A3NF15_MYCAS|nr:nucleoside hydrolase [Mycobacterium asiaticum]OBK19900.1 nucleoside hydrolase [Mycobacterium asiaticum]